MSILSSERFYGNNICIDVTETYEHVDISFFPAISGSSITAGTRVTINDTEGNYYYANNNLGAITYTTTSSYSSSHTCVGFRFVMAGQYLKCLKKELSHAVLANSTSFVNASLNTQTTPCHLNEAFDCIKDKNVVLYAIEKILALANRYKVIVPWEFQDKTPYATVNGIIRELSYVAIDWLAYPLVREMNSVSFCKNLSYYDRTLIAPNCNHYNFKQLVEYYCGHSTSKMLEEIWKALTFGEEVQCYPIASFASVAIGDPLEIAPSIVPSMSYHVGTKRLQTLAFTLAPAVFKVMGFDYLYQLLPQIPKGGTTGAIEGQPVNYHYELEPNIRTLNNILGPKKLMGILIEICDISKIHDLRDAVRMIEEYSTVDKIPQSLRNEFPSGLVIDFKFKNLKEMHDKISTQYTIIKAEADKKEIPVHPFYAQLDGREEKGLKLIVPRNTTFLSIWGKALNICIASYGDIAARGDTLLLGVEKEGAIKYCIEFECKIVPSAFSQIDSVLLPLPRLEPKQAQASLDTSEEDSTYLDTLIRQFRAERNGNPDAQDKEIVIHMLHMWADENKVELIKMSELFTNTSDWTTYRADNIVVDNNALNAYNAARIVRAAFAADQGPQPDAVQNNAAEINIVGNPNMEPDVAMLVYDGENRPPVAIQNLG